MAPPGRLSDTARVEAFSDGVFAIAITLLVLEIRVPAPDATQHGRALLAALRGLWPSYLGYALSFVTIGIMWSNHHSIFHYVRRADRYFVLINVLFLMCISFLPFPTALLAEYLPEPGGRTLAVAGYSDRDAVRTISRRYAAGPISYAVSFGLAFVNVWASLAVHALLAALYLLPEHRRAAHAAASPSRRTA